MVLTSIKNLQNVFVQLITLLKIDYTQSYSSKYYNEHPYKNTLFGLSKMLSAYRINNVGLRLNNKNELCLLETPFIAQLQEDFVVVYKITSDKVSYLWKEKDITITSDYFNKAWSGVVLVAEPDQKSIEPDYKKHKKNELLGVIEKYAFCSGVIMMASLFYISNEIFAHIGLNLCLIINLVGVYIGYLLVLKQLHIQSDSADKLCSLFKKGDCNNVLESPAAKFMGIIGWSEVGLGYFLSNTLIILFVPQCMSYLVLINICALPYSFWSIWYQRVKVKQWCPLCLIVQGLLWAVFMVNLFFGFIQIPHMSVIGLIMTACVYMMPFLVISLLLPRLSESMKIEKITQEINSLRMKDKVFLTLLKEQPHYEIDRSVSKIQWGNPDADLLITILTNPQCNHCAVMHIRLEKILEKYGDKLCVQYVFTGFGDRLYNIRRKMIAIYMNHDREVVNNAFDDWFRRGRLDENVFFKKYNTDITHSYIEEEFQKHCQWEEKNSLKATPSTLVNGYKLPPGYKIEDIIYFMDLIVDTK